MNKVNRKNLVKFLICFSFFCLAVAYFYSADWNNRIVGFATLILLVLVYFFWGKYWRDYQKNFWTILNQIIKVENEPSITETHEAISKLLASNGTDIESMRTVMDFCVRLPVPKNGCFKLNSKHLPYSAGQTDIYTDRVHIGLYTVCRYGLNSFLIQEASNVSFESLSNCEAVTKRLEGYLITFDPDTFDSPSYGVLNVTDWLKGGSETKKYICNIYANFVAGQRVNQIQWLCKVRIN